jgi:DNA-directed RNA polymerase specialized sigma24 family protein
LAWVTDLVGWTEVGVVELAAGPLAAKWRSTPPVGWVSCVDSGVAADQREFEEWVRARTPALARSAFLLTGDVHLAEDLVQDTLVRIADHWHRLKREGSPDAYTRQVMHRLSIDRWRRRRARVHEVLHGRSHPRGPGAGPG